LEQEVFPAEDRENLKLKGLADNKKGGANAPPFVSKFNFIQADNRASRDKTRLLARTLVNRHADLAGATAGFNIDIKHALQALRPGH